MATTTAPGTTSTTQKPTLKPQPNGIPSQTASSTPPNQTLYIANLPTSKISKTDLKRGLYCLFVTYGPVLDVIAMRGDKRGWAHVCFRDVGTASQAMRALQGVEVFGRELKISYAKGKSNIISRLEGSVKGPSAEARPAPAAPAMTATQQSIFQNPNASLPSKPGAPVTAVAPSTPAQAPAVNGNVTTETELDTEGPHGTKRSRAEADKEEEEGDEGAPMEEDSGGEAMEESDSD